jgi:hypothetical protein
MPKYSASFRVQGKDLDPDVITVLLGITPDHTHKCGDPRIGEDGVASAPYSHGQWSIYSSDVKFPNPGDCLKSLTSRLSSKAELLREIRSKGYRMDIFIGMFEIQGNSTMSISSETLSELAKLGINLEFDMYAARP